MADLTDIQAALPTKLTGAGATGTETNFVNADSNGNLNVITPSEGTPASSVPSKTMAVGGKDISGNLQIERVDSSGNQYVNLQDGLGNALNSITYGTVNRNLNVQVGYGTQVDAYTRVRTVSPEIMFGIYFSNTTHPLLLNTALTGSGTTTFQSNSSALRLTNTTSSSDSVIVQTKRYLRYNPGVSYLLGVSGILGAKKTNVRQRWGYFDANNGMFLEQTGTDLAIVTRTNTSGSPVDTRVLQASWNIDKLDGTGPSGMTLDTSKHNLFVADFVWQGAGPIRFGIMNGRNVIYFHEVLNSNSNTVPYFRDPSLPGRVELTNTGAAASSTNLDLVCFTAIKEGGDFLFPPYTFTAAAVASKTTLPNGGTTALPVLSIRPKATFNSLTNRVPIVPIVTNVLTIQKPAYMQVLLNPTLTGASWTSVGTNSATEYDISATALSGGTKLVEFYVPQALNYSFDLSTLVDIAVLGLDIAGTTQDILCIAGIGVTGTTDTYATIQFQEFQ